MAPDDTFSTKNATLAPLPPHVIFDAGHGTHCGVFTPEIIFGGRAEGCSTLEFPGARVGSAFSRWIGEPRRGASKGPSKSGYEQG